MSRVDLNKRFFKEFGVPTLKGPTGSPTGCVSAKGDVVMA